MEVAGRRESGPRRVKLKGDPNHDDVGIRAPAEVLGAALVGVKTRAAGGPARQTRRRLKFFRVAELRASIP